MSLSRIVIFNEKADEKLASNLETHFAQMQREGLIRGSFSSLAFNAHENSDIVLLLISPDFLASDRCMNEANQAMIRRDIGTAIVIPIIMRPCDWETTSFGKLKALPSGGKPIVKWRSSDAAFLNVVRGIREVIKQLAETHANESFIFSVISTAFPRIGKIINWFKQKIDT